jgi:serine/threonine-protein kinase
VREAALRYFGDFQLISELGRGGMGIVYRARHLTLNRSIALKLIAPERLNSPRAVERFHAEAEATANLDHRISSQFMRLARSKAAIISR